MGVNMKDIKKKIAEYEKLLDTQYDNLDEEATNKIVAELDQMITQLENTISNDLSGIDIDEEDLSDWDVTLMDGLDEE